MGPKALYILTSKASALQHDVCRKPVPTGFGALVSPFDPKRGKTSLYPLCRSETGCEAGTGTNPSFKTTPASLKFPSEGTSSTTPKSGTCSEAPRNNVGAVIILIGFWDIF